jgi:hypothetical protein
MENASKPSLQTIAKSIVLKDRYNHAKAKQHTERSHRAVL